MRLLVLEDDPEVRDFLERALREAGYQVTAAATAESALEQVKRDAHDAFVVDLNLPGMDGLWFIQTCRERGIGAPVLILSARRSVDERVRGLEKGGDDYLTKPFSLAELLARIRALLRRTGQQQAEAARLRVADLELDLLRHEARRGEELIPLTSKEFSLLEYLCRNQRRVVTRTMILDHVWGMRFDPATNIVDVHIHRLRAKIDDDRPVKLIHTLRGSGYVLEER
jgi:DNA-binding response OmpR family regulator